MSVEENILVPRMIHFIWAGGDKLMNECAVETIAQWCLQNASCKVILWVDSDYSGGMPGLISAYGALFFKHSVIVHEVNNMTHTKLDTRTQVKLEADSKQRVYIKDIAEFKDEIYLSEIRQVSPNFGCSSDILRLRILAKYGGCYFDQDVAPHPEYRLESCDFFRPEKHHTIGLEHKSQKLPPDSTEKNESKAIGDFYRFNITTIGNDSLIASAGNPVIQGMLSHVEKNYHVNKKDRKRIIEESYGSRDKHNRTIIRTGSYALKDYLKKNTSFDSGTSQLILNNEEKVKIKVEAIRKLGRILTIPKKNTRHWLNITSHNQNYSTDIIFEKTIQRINFEINHFKVISLDLHLHNFFEAFPVKTKKQTDHWVDIILSKVSRLDLEQVAMAQISPDYKKTIRFCENHHLTTLFNLNESEFIYAIQNQLHIGELHGLSHYLKYQAVTLGKPYSVIKSERPDLTQRLADRTHSCLNTLQIILKPPFSKLFSSEQMQLLCRYFTKQKNHFTFIKSLYKKDDALLDKKITYLFYTLSKFKK